MTTLDQNESASAQCPVTHFHDVSRSRTEGGWHFANFDAKREQAPVHQGKAGEHDYFLVTRMADIRASFQNHQVFANSAVVPSDPDPPYMWIPEMLDGQIHTTWRQLLGPLFSPAAIAALEPNVRKRFGEILDDVADRGECDFVQDVGLVFPNTIFMDIMGLPRADAATFQHWETEILHTGYAETNAGQRQFDAMMAVSGYFADLIAERRRDPREDILSVALSWKIDGEPIPDSDMLAFCLLMFMAGLDTVAAQLAYSFWHLSTHDDDRRRIVTEPTLIPGAIEEFLRYYAFVTPGRKVVQDTEIAGCPIAAGKMIFMPIASANRDPREFADADKVIIDRADNRHIAFGAGPHRCLGVHLARQELRIAMEMWHERIPEYRLRDGAEVLEHGGQIGLDSLPLVWDV
jgi:cytochrome P450